MMFRIFIFCCFYLLNDIRRFSEVVCFIVSYDVLDTYGFIIVVCGDMFAVTEFVCFLVGLFI